GSAAYMAGQVLSGTKLSSVIPAAYLKIPGTAQIGIYNLLDGGQSATIPFTITSAPSGPSITSLSPSSAQTKGAAFTMTVDGAGFVNGAVVKWTQNGQTTALSTQYVSAVRLTASVPAGLLQSPGNVQVTVSNPTGNPSGPSTFVIAAS